MGKSSEKTRAAKGVRYQKHATRRHGVQPDRYYTLVYKYAGKTKEEGVGWASEGVKLDECIEMSNTLRKNRKNGLKPGTLAELRAMQEEETRREERQVQLEAAANITFGSLWLQYKEKASMFKGLVVMDTDEKKYSKWLKPDLGQKSIKDICEDDLEKIQKKMLEAGRSPTTIHHIMVLFGTVWNWAIKRGMTAKVNPRNNVPDIPYNSNKERIPSDEEMDSILNKIKERAREAWEFAFTACHTGARLSEAALIQWANIDLGSRQINLIHTKTKRPRSIPMTDEVFKILASKERGNPGDYVFLQKNGKTWWFTHQSGGVKTYSPWQFRRVIDDLKLNEGFTRKMHITFHSMRHWLATKLLREGTDPRTIQDLMGWSTLAMLERYTHVLPPDKRKAIQSVIRRTKQEEQPQT